MDLGRLRTVRLRDLAIRFAFGAAISVGAALLTIAVDPRFGGAFLAFPAILPASLTLIAEKEGERMADRNAVGAVLGGLGLAVFAMIGERTFTHVDGAVAIVLALGGWVVSSFALYAALAAIDPNACDADQD